MINSRFGLKRKIMDYSYGLQTGRHSGIAFYTSKQEFEILSSVSSMDGRCSHVTRRVHSSSASPRARQRYIPSLYHNQDKILAKKIKEFLKKPPLNSQEYFDTLWKLRQDESFLHNEGNSEAVKSAPHSPDELSEKLWHLLPEKRTIQSMILPPIRDGCVANYHNKFMDASGRNTIIDPSIDIVEQLKYCRYLRLKHGRQKAWEDS